MIVTLAEIAAAAGGRVEPAASASVQVDGFAHDSRSLVPGSLFCAILDRRDGHAFVADAIRAGAGAAMVERRPETVDPEVPIVIVESVIASMANVAAWARRVHLADATVVGITGSTGKTSTKDLLRAALATRRQVHANDASFNNEIGLPTTLLAAPVSTEFVICEMGARFVGNIADLCAIAAPNIGLITNIGTAHGEHLGGPAGVLAVKSELLAALPERGLAVLPADDATLASLRSATRSRVLTAGADVAADVVVRVLDLDAELRADIELQSPWGKVRARLGLRGVHQAANAALAATVALDAGIDPDDVGAGLEAARGSAWRMELSVSQVGTRVLNDSYNANPQSVAAAIDALASLTGPNAGRRIAVLGVMRELGEHSEAEHRAIGRRVAAHGIDVLVTVGDDSDISALAEAARADGVAVVEVSDVAAATSAIAELGLGPDDAVLVKASRAVGLERVAAAILEAMSRESGPPIFQPDLDLPTDRSAAGGSTSAAGGSAQ